MIYSINMHTTVYQFWRFVYHPEQSVIDNYARSSFYTRSFCTAIKLYLGHFLWPLFIQIPLSVCKSEVCPRTVSSLSSHYCSSNHLLMHWFDVVVFWAFLGELERRHICIIYAMSPLFISFKLLPISVSCLSFGGILGLF